MVSRKAEISLWLKSQKEVVVDRFYIALFSALEQTHCVRM